MNTATSTDTQDQNNNRRITDIAAWIESLSETERALLNLITRLVQGGATARQADTIVKAVRTVQANVGKSQPDENGFYLYQKVKIKPGKFDAEHGGETGVIVSIEPAVPGGYEEGRDVPPFYDVYFGKATIHGYEADWLMPAENLDKNETVSDLPAAEN